MINRLEKYDLEFVDQPVLMYNLEGLARVRNAVNVPVSSHESSWTFYEALNVIKRGVADAIHVDPRWDAGFTGARITAGIAEAAGLPVLTHSYYELGIAQCAYMHLIASCPNFILANQSGYDSLIDDVIMGGRLEFKDGCMDLPEKPGIGVELDPQRVEKYHAAYEENVKGKEPPSEVPLYRFMSYRNYFK
jgi:L-alanine-DL-glutamate epimerase-like enolase superfamily enzyme